MVKGQGVHITVYGESETHMKAENSISSNNKATYETFLFALNEQFDVLNIYTSIISHAFFCGVRHI